MRFIRKLSNTGSLRRCQGLAVPLEISGRGCVSRKNVVGIKCNRQEFLKFACGISC